MLIFFSVLEFDNKMISGLDIQKISQDFLLALDSGAIIYIFP